MDEVVPFGETNFRNRKQKFGIKTDDRRRHVYVIGKTGMGKTTLLENLVIDDIQAGRGVAVVDPHGEFAEKILDFVPANRLHDVIYFNPADIEHPIAFNVLEQVAPEHRHLITDGLVGVFQKLWAETWGPRLEYVLRNSILALLEVPDSTLLGIMRILVDKEYRKSVIDILKDPVVKAFWVNEFARYPDRFMAEAISPIQNKVGQFLTNPLIRNIVGQSTTSIDLREVMDSEKIVILNLSKGRVGEGTSKLLGAMMITKLQLAAMSRVDISEEERKDFYLYVDEFQNFATTSFVNILSEARKYRLNLILAHQYIEQLEEPVQAAVLGNVGTLIAFRVGAPDSELFEKEFGPDFMAIDLVNLSKYNIYLKLMIDGAASRAFSATTLAPYPKTEISYRQEIIEYSRKMYASSRQDVEAAIEAWAGPIETIEGTEAKGPGAKKRKDDRPMYDAMCWVCQQPTRVPFPPDGVRAIYCQNCLGEIRAGTRQPLSPRQAPRDIPPPKFAPTERETQAPAMVVSSVPDSGQGISLEHLAQSPRPAPPQGSGQAPPERLSSQSPAAFAQPNREKNQRPQKPRPSPDLSGLRGILEDVLEEEKDR